MTPDTTQIVFPKGIFKSALNSPKIDSLRAVFSNLRIFDNKSDEKVFKNLISYVFSYDPFFEKTDETFNEQEFSEIIKADFVKDVSIFFQYKRLESGSLEIKSTFRGCTLSSLLINEEAYPFIDFVKFKKHVYKNSNLRSLTSDFSIDKYKIDDDADLPPFDECIKNKDWMNILRYSALYIRVSQYRKSKDFSCLQKGLPLSFLLYSLKEKYPARFPSKSGHVPMMIDAVNAASEIPGALKIHGDPGNVPPEVMEVLSRHMAALNMRDQMIQEDQKVKIRGKTII